MVVEMLEYVRDCLPVVSGLDGEIDMRFRGPERFRDAALVLFRTNIMRRY
jgi:hypothetical protein